MGTLQDLGLVTAYGYAKAGGYSGSEAEFESYLAGLVDYTTAAANSATAAANSVTSATSVYSDTVNVYNNTVSEAAQAADAEDRAEQFATASATSMAGAATHAAAAAASALAASTSETNSADYEAETARQATTATTQAQRAQQFAIDAEESETRCEALEHSSEQWSNLAYQYAQAFGGLVFKGSVEFANIPFSGMSGGDMYDIKDAFVTDNRFKEGSGVSCVAGTDIAWSASDSKWNILTPTGVNTFNGRNGAVIPAANDYSADQIQYGSNSDVETELDKKQPTYAGDNTAWDAVPTQNSNNPVISDGIYSAIDNITPIVSTTDIGEGASLATGKIYIVVS